MMTKKSKSEDRAYTRAEIQKIIIHCEDIPDKVIIIGFSSGGFRLEAWDYFTWSDVVFFKNEYGAYQGEEHYESIMGGVEEYCTRLTPEFCNFRGSYCLTHDQSK